MEYYAGIDVSLESVSIRVVYATGRIMRGYRFAVSDAPFPRCLGRRLRDDGASWLGGGCGSLSK